MTYHSYILTLDNEAKTKTAERQVREHWLLLRLAPEIFCCATAQLERQSQLSRLNILFYLKKKRKSALKGLLK